MIFLLFVATFVSLAAAAFCAGAETCFLSVSRERVLHLAREGGRKAQLVQSVLSRMAHTTATLLIGNNIASVAYSTATAALIADLCSDSTMRSVWSFIAAFTVLYVSEFMPKLLCAARPLRRSLRLVAPYLVLEELLTPLVDVSMRLTDVFLRGKKKEQAYEPTAADIRRILQDRKDGVCLSDIESTLIQHVIALRAKQQTVTAEAILEALRK